ncbi:hypothetical protein [Piscinibacter terrae]|uniref:Uncharacterized protein n=1 Tax=Piscinibacter terrae TaxID=2496871 RepID=A0A3N7HI79_9BURK|nr:hypothetical protein [Albitalea terrae]RQP21740.1 hypothetical protein DZC73_25170 [Albitalea terrae]
MTRVHLCLNVPGSAFPGESPGVVAALECSAGELRIGANGLYLRQGDLLPVALWIDDQRLMLDGAPPFEFRSFSGAQRQQSRTFFDWLCGRFDGLARLKPTGARWMPSIAAVERDDGRMSFFHLVQQGEPGAMFVLYRDEALATGDGLAKQLWCQTPGHAERLDTLRPALGDECWYTKWRPEIEMERKFTFAGIPDTWALLHALHAGIAGSGESGFVPELDREIQVWDYEQHIFEVLGGNAESGYIAYIPQADGLMTVKRKWFVENCEIRRESLWVEKTLRLQEIDSHVATLTAERTRRLPSYRRKRFDAQFESLQTGNIFGIYMDVCRTLDSRAAFSQCEIEYCRTRTFAEIRGVEADFESFCGHVGAQLRSLGVPFQQDLYSKLDFVRSVADEALDQPYARELRAEPA